MGSRKDGGGESYHGNAQCGCVVTAVGIQSTKLFISWGNRHRLHRRGDISASLIESMGVC